MNGPNCEYWSDRNTRNRCDERHGRDMTVMFFGGTVDSIVSSVIKRAKKYGNGNFEISAPFRIGYRICSALEMQMGVGTNTAPRCKR